MRSERLLKQLKEAEDAMHVLFPGTAYPSGSTQPYLSRLLKAAREQIEYLDRERERYAKLYFESNPGAGLD